MHVPESGKLGGLSGKVAVVTGGSRGIGRAICSELAGRGADIAVNYRARADAAEETVSAVRALGVRAVAVAADVGNRTDVANMVAGVTTSLGRPDILVNNAGLLRMGELLSYDEGEFDRMWKTNVKGVLHCSQALAPGMIKAGWGRIVNIASNAAVGTAMPGTTLYAVTKGAVLTLTKRMAFELSPRGITVNAVLPGFTKTDMVLSDKTAEEVERLLSNVASRSLVGRTGDPEDIASVAGFLCSPASGFMTGQFLMADGGRQDYLTHV